MTFTATINGRPVSVVELARRLCVRTHPTLSSTNQPVPCGQHIANARAYYHLLTPEGTHEFEVIRDIREQFGIDAVWAEQNGVHHG